MKILIVDDDLFTLDNIEAKLSLMFNFSRDVEIIKKSSFETAKAELEKNNMDIIFLDANLSSTQFSWDLAPYIKNEPIIYFLSNDFEIGMKKIIGS